jgi:hypothetical protein
MADPQPNLLLRAARQRTESPHWPGQPMSRTELADAVRAWIEERTGTRYGLDAHYIAKLERGVIRWPNPAYRAGLCQILHAPGNDALGFAPPDASFASFGDLADTDHVGGHQ